MPSWVTLIAATPTCAVCGRKMKCNHKDEWWWCASVNHPGRKIIRQWTILVSEQER